MSDVSTVSVGTPLVSIMMPAWNVESYIGEAIQSTLEQTYQNWELCICDDGSTDDTVEVIEEYMKKEPRIKLEKFPNHMGCPQARNQCLEMMGGEIFARLDADDMHHPERLKSQVEFLQGNPKFRLCSTGFSHMWNTGKMGRGQRAEMIPKKYMMGNGGSPVQASIVAWKEVYNKVGNFDTKYLYGSDGDWAFRCILEDFKWGYIDERYYYYRVRPHQISKDFGRIQMRNHHGFRNKYRKIWLKRGKR